MLCGASEQANVRVVGGEDQTQTKEVRDSTNVCSQFLHELHVRDSMYGESRDVENWKMSHRRQGQRQAHELTYGKGAQHLRPVRDRNVLDPSAGVGEVEVDHVLGGRVKVRPIETVSANAKTEGGSDSGAEVF